MLAVMFSWMAHGHINSFLELAKSLTTSISDVQVVVHLVSMPANLTPLARDQTDKIKLVELLPTGAPGPPARAAQHQATLDRPDGVFQACM